jgi:hypothetical protein
MSLVSISEGYNGSVAVYDTSPEASQIINGTTYHPRVALFVWGKQYPLVDSHWYAGDLLAGHAKARHQYTAHEIRGKQ